MKKTITKITSIILVLVTICSMFTITASAVSTKAFDILTSSKYAKVYTLSSSGITIPYTSKSLATRGSVTYGASKSAYIDNKSDELRLVDVGVTNGKYWAKVSYPIGSKRAYAYIALSAITSNNGSHAKTTSTGKFYCSYRKGVSTSSSYYVAKNDTVYLIATSGSQYQIMYPISNGQWRIGWCSKANYNKYCVNTPTSASTPVQQSNNTSFSRPVKTGSISQGFGKYCSWRNNSNYGHRPYHLGVDYCASEGTNVYAITSGIVKFAGYAGSSNAYTVVIQHTISGKTVYSFYAHFNSTKDLKVKAGEKVTAGQLIGYMGDSGSSTAPHTHVGIVDTYWNGSYYGYSASFNSGAKKYSCNINGTGTITYYDPEYVVQYGKLP